MGWVKKGRLVVPDESDEVGTSEVDGEKVTPSGLIVSEDVPTAPPPPPKELKRMIEQFQKRAAKKQRKEANKKFLNERFGYLRSPKPKEGTAPSGK
jgi:hypothetical protein